jgi:hypothetical protein
MILHWAIFLAFDALVALGFLIYSLGHLKKLGITWRHPRVLVEGALFLVFALAALLLYLSA